MRHLVSRAGLALLASLLTSVSFADEADMATGIGDEQLAAIGQRWADALSTGDAATLRALMDFEGLGLRGAASLTSNETQRASFVRGFASNGDRMVESWVSGVASAEGQARFLRVHTWNGMRGPLVRYDLGEHGYNYVLLIVEARAAVPRVVDLFLALDGQRLSDSLAAATQMLTAPDESMIGRVFGLQTVDADIAGMFRTIGRLQLLGRVDEAYSLIVQLPEEIRNHRVMMNISLPLASQLGEDVHREELARLARYHGSDPTAVFALIDYYFYEGDTKAAMEGIRSLERAFGADAATEQLKASVALEDGDLARAREHMQKAVELEPDNEIMRWALLGVLMMANQHAAAIGVLDRLERDFGYEFNASEFSDSEGYAAFLKSPEFTAWIAKRGAGGP
jgi:thioredoxin-like negative regulator of GroEL